MENIIIVECMSTGIYFVQDIVDRNYNPIVLDSKLIDNEVGRTYNHHKQEDLKLITEDYTLITEKDTYEETLEMVREYDPVLILPGSERGVALATRLANDLNLLSNSYDNIEAMTLKDKMQERLKENGLRSIRGQVVKSVEEAIEFYESEDLKKVVIKPSYSAASSSVKICLSKDDMISNIKELFNDYNCYGDENAELLVQEYIEGEEYIVNTVSSEGKHRVTLIWKYSKVKTSDGSVIYDIMETVDELSLGEAEMVEYAYNVADAIGIEYGPIHGEYMIDEKGPVLVEVNCRPCGGTLAPEFLDRISGQHETDSVLDAYLKPELFNQKRRRPYRLFAKGVIKDFIVPYDLVAESTSIHHIGKNLESHYKTVFEDISLPGKSFIKTKDLMSSCGLIYLVNEDYYTLQKEIDFLHDIEKNAFSLILSEKSDKSNIDSIDYAEIKPLLEEANLYGSSLLVSDVLFDDLNLKQVKPLEIDSIIGDYDSVFINVSKSIHDLNGEEITKIFLNSISHVKKGGFLFVPALTYEAIPGGRKVLEGLVKTLKLRIVVPPSDYGNVIIASKT
ncbi:ATP-grasp domain-containing protein [Methanobrevibacter sp.]|uniref:ATP-grasp domain-containing protein n=1 Tax=Methanobrevibacter sp. TaxID=66852 RepID=UPI003891150C